MSFEERSQLAKKFENLMDILLKQIGFMIVDISYERIFPVQIREKLRYLYNDSEVLYVRFQPDRFAYLNKEKIFFIEYKVCNTPIKSQKRVEDLRKISNDKTLDKTNIGAIEATAYYHYKELAQKLNLRVILIIYSGFYPKRIVAEFINNIKIKNESEVIYGVGNASRTPYVNINLDEFKPIYIFLKDEFGINIKKETYRRILKKMDNGV